MSNCNLTPKQENFCLEYLKTGNASEAYRLAYDAEKMKPETINKKAAELIRLGHITARINELKQPIIDGAQITFESHLKKLAELRDAAAAKEEFSAAITAETNRGKAAGLYTTKVEANVDASVNVNIRRFTPDPRN